MSRDQGRVPAILADIARFAVNARRVVDRGRERFMDRDDDDQRRIARSHPSTMGRRPRAVEQE